METKHFFKTLILFLGMIILGLIGVSLVNHFGQKGERPNMLDNVGSVIK